MMSFDPSQIDLKANLEVRDPIQHWIQEAYYFSNEINISTNFIEEAKNIVVGAFSEPWLNELFNRRKHKDSLSYGYNCYLENLFRLAGKAGVVELIELAIYLKKSIKFLKQNEVISIMKENNSYNTALLQLAFAYRFSKCGATDIEFEPNVDNGKKADLYFKYNAKPFIVECYCPDGPKLKPNSFDYLKKTTRAVFNKTLHRDTTIGINLILKKAISKNETRDFITKTICVKLDEYQSGSCEEYDCDDFFLSISDQAIKSDKDIEKIMFSDIDLSALISDSQIIVQKLCRQSEVKNIRRGIGASSIKRNCVLEIKLSKSEFEDINDEPVIKNTLKTLKKKISQTKRSSDSPERLIIIDVSKIKGLARISNENLANLHSILRWNSKSPINSIITERRFTYGNRFQYQGMFFDGSSLPNDLIAKIQSLEGQFDILQDF